MNLTSEQQFELLKVLEERFVKNSNRHPGQEWQMVKEKIEKNHQKLVILYKMESSGGQPDLVFFEEEPEILYYVDCSPQSPEGRRNLCYDREALDNRKKNKPRNSALDCAKEMGIELLTEEQYRQLQKFGEFDTKTSSWIKTPVKIRKLGGAVFCERRYDTVFMYHNGADSYYSARGFRGCLKI